MLEWPLQLPWMACIKTPKLGDQCRAEKSTERSNALCIKPTQIPAKKLLPTAFGESKQRNPDYVL
ncbi:MAG: hypothetical protein CVV06_02895 [Gammaproteobacteria bacterium HGW-Gammaproteobacteria-10]|nr:MAG: hypothetical protein CVV06_02895 [Gammaproteobacteria bacterium HGW-Gammaproteobacteria-10]